MWKVLGIIILLVIAIQLARPSRSNPAAAPEKSLAAQTHPPAEVERILARSCNDCHSNLTRWPWYSGIAPFSWIVSDDVRDGRRHLNFSHWEDYDPGKRAKLLAKICEETRDGGMPLWAYTVVHRGTALSGPERDQVCRWTAAERAGAGASTQLPPTAD
jgi:hypothetical protein